MTMMPSAKPTPQTQLGAPILVCGPAHSGKSELAMRMLAPDQPALVLGTAIHKDAFLARRLAALQALRPAAWQTQESGLDLPASLAAACDTQKGPRQILIDSVSQWLANTVVAATNPTTQDAEHDLEALLEAHVDVLCRLITEIAPAYRVVMVSAEAGAGPAPERVAERHYRRALGLTNQRLAALAKSVVLVQAGIATLLKETPGNMP